MSHFSNSGLRTSSLLLLALSGPAWALTELEDSQMSDIAGAGLALALDDFSFRVAPTSYIELSGTPPTAAAATAGWSRGDVRYYGWSFTGNGAGTDWYDNGCSGTETVLSCPLGTTSVANFAPVYDPFVLRVFQYEGYDFQGNWLTNADRPTVLELVGPSQSDPWRWSFWGEIEVDRDVAHVQGASHADATFLQSQTIISGKPITKDGTPAIFQLMQTSNDDDRTLGLTYQSALSGDFRFSVNHTTNSPDTLHNVPDFGNAEGIHFKDVDAFIPFGHLHSQAITLDDHPTADDGNFSITVTSIPNNANIYNEIYCGANLSLGDAACATVVENVDYFDRSTTTISNPNNETHGYIRWGDFSVAPPDATSRANGIYFVDPSGGVTNIGVARMEGVLIQHMRLTTLGAQ